MLVLLNEFKELTLLARILARFVHNRLGHLGVCHLNFGFLTQLSEQQAQTDTAASELDVLLGRRDFWVIMALNFRVFVMPQLVRDLACLCVEKRRLQIKGHELIKRVEQTTLHNSALRASIFGFQALGDLAFQAREVFCTKLLCQLVVELSGFGLLYVFDFAFKDRGFASKVLCLILFSEAHFDVLLIARFYADELLFKAWNEAV